MFNIKYISRIKMYEDNSEAITIAKFGNFTKNAKHIKVQYNYVNENYEAGMINVLKVD